MPRADIRLGEPVLSRDGHRLGSVDRLVLDQAGRRVEALVVHKILQAGDKVIDMGLVERVGVDGIVLRVDASEAAKLPAFVHEGYVELTPDAALQDTYASLSPAGGGSLLAAAPVAGRQTVEAATASLFDPAIPAGAVVEEESSVPAEDDVIGAGTDVLAADGRKVGTVAEVLVGPDGGVTGFVVKAGHLFKHDVQVPIERVAEVGDRHIHLNITAEQAEAAGQ